MRFRFEKASQMIEMKKGDIAILPVSEWKEGCWAEIPALVYPKDEASLIENLMDLKAKGLTDVVCENLSGIMYAKELGLTAHGGMYLNALNSESIKEYKELGLVDITMSMELNFSEAKKLKADMPIGFTIYGYLPLMKFRACPGECSICKGQSTMTDRLGEKFTLICRDKKYSELLNSVPLYVGDRQLPKCDFTTLYFTIESKSEIEDIVEITRKGESVDGRKTAGLYFRELL